LVHVIEIGVRIILLLNRSSSPWYLTLRVAPGGCCGVGAGWPWTLTLIRGLLFVAIVGPGFLQIKLAWNGSRAVPDRNSSVDLWLVVLWWWGWREYVAVVRWF